ncbi:MAG: FAD-dependent oxidoreductase [Bacillus subtilis]|nr:FAD-dependent oxidoreductase [Bacillus subtilis]
MKSMLDMFKPDKYMFQEVQKVDLSPETKMIETQEFIFKSKTVIIATGAQPRKMDIPGEEQFSGRGVSYCAGMRRGFFQR